MNKYLKVPTHNPNVCIRILQLNTANPFRRSVMAGPSLLQPPPCRGGVISVHHDPVHGIVTNPGNREWGRPRENSSPWGRPPLSFSVVCDNPVHRVLVNWDPPHFPVSRSAWYNPKLYLSGKKGLAPSLAPVQLCTTHWRHDC